MSKTRKENPKFKKGKGMRGYSPKKTNPDVEMCPGNDFAWYNKNPQLLTSAGSLVFSKRYGDLYKSISYTGSQYTLDESGNRSVGGVVRADFFEFISAMGTDADPINVAAKNLYTWLRHKNSGAKVYEASDLIQVLLSSGSVKAALEYAKTLLRCVASYSAVNRFAMRAVIPYSDAEFSNMVANLANYTARLNMIIAKATSIVIPKDIPLFSRWKWLSANVFRDDELKKCSYYTFRPEMIWHYDWANHKCTVNSIITTTYVGLLNAIETEIDNLLQYDDYGTISGDILKAYGEGALDVTTGISLGEIQDPTYDADAIRQFKNMIVAGGNQSYELNQVSGNTQLLYTVAQNTYDQNNLPGKYTWQTTSFDSVFDKGIVYLPKLAITSDQPSVNEIVEQTRLSGVIKTYEDTVNSEYRAYFEEVGTEVITQARIYYYNDYNTQLHQSNSLETLQFLDGSSAVDFRDFVSTRFVSIGIKGDPQICVCIADGADISFCQYFHGDNIAVLDEQFLTTLHKACVLSEWTMPMFNFLEVK